MAKAKGAAEVPSSGEESGTAEVVSGGMAAEDVEKETKGVY